MCLNIVAVICINTSDAKSDSCGIPLTTWLLVFWTTLLVMNFTQVLAVLTCAGFLIINCLAAPFLLGWYIYGLVIWNYDINDCSDIDVTSGLATFMYVTLWFPVALLLVACCCMCMFVVLAALKSK